MTTGIIDCEEDNFFRDILGSIPYRIWVMNTDLDVVWENRMSRGEDTVSCAPASLLTATWRAQILPSGMLPEVLAELKEALNERSGVLEFKRRDAEGIDSWIRVSYNPVYDGSGNQVGIYGLEKDITMQKEVLPRLVKLRSSSRKVKPTEALT